MPADPERPIARNRGAQAGRSAGGPTQSCRRILVAGIFSVVAASACDGVSPRRATSASAPAVLDAPEPAALAAAQGTVERIVRQVRAALPDVEVAFALVVRLRARPGVLDRVLASYAAQAEGAATNPGSLVYHVNQDPADRAALLLYEGWRNFGAFVAHETAGGTIAHFARTADWLTEERSLEVVVSALL